VLFVLFVLVIISHGWCGDDFATALFVLDSRAWLRYSGHELIPHVGCGADFATRPDPSSSTD
jgi:hypothetical protein